MSTTDIEMEDNWEYLPVDWTTTLGEREPGQNILESCKDLITWDPDTDIEDLLGSIPPSSPTSSDIVESMLVTVAESSVSGDEGYATSNGGLTSELSEFPDDDGDAGEDGHVGDAGGDGHAGEDGDASNVGGDGAVDEDGDIQMVRLATFLSRDRRDCTSHCVH